MYVKVINNEVVKFPYTSTDLRRDNPSKSFPENVTEQAFLLHGAYPVTLTDVPDYDSATHRVNQSVHLVDGVWTQRWTLEEVPQGRASSNIRGKRNVELSNSDWTQFTDSPLSSEKRLEWSQYRTSLRALPQQEGFPYNVNWPTKPE